MLFVYLELIYMILPFKIHLSVNTNVNHSGDIFPKAWSFRILGCARKQNDAKARRYESRSPFHLSHKWAECNRVVTEIWEKNITLGKASSLVKFSPLGWTLHVISLLTDRRLQET